MQHVVRKFIEDILDKHKDAVSNPIYEFGSYRCEMIPDEDLRPLFEGMEFHGCDIRKGEGVDEIRDVMETGLVYESVGVVICVETLEHVLDPWKAIHEAYRILKPEGLFILTAPFSFPIHDHPYDYWRFTPEIFEQFFSFYQKHEVIFNEELVTVKHNLNKLSEVMGWGIK